MMPFIRTLSDSERLYWLRLARSENVGSSTFYRALNLCGSPEKALVLLPDLSLRGGRKKPITIFSESQAQQELAQCEAIGARIIASCEPDYPSLLRQIKFPPPVITVLGKVTLLNRPCIAMVGARNASANACRYTQSLAEKLGKNGITIVSGLAKGVDAAAHAGSLDTGTVGVVAGGIDYIYPKENTKLYHQMKECGAIIAELPIGAIPMGRNFPQRNRIISGLSAATLVVEATLGSGSLITANFALEQGREVLAIPGAPYDPRARGTNSLLKQGATLVETAEDIMEVLHAGSPVAFRDIEPADELMEPKNDNYRELAMALAAPEEIKSMAEQVTVAETLEARDQVLRLIGHLPVGIDDIIATTNLPTPVVLTLLLEMELAGLLQRHAGNKVSMIFSQNTHELPLTAA